MLSELSSSFETLVVRNAATEIAPDNHLPKPTRLLRSKMSLAGAAGKPSTLPPMPPVGLPQNETG
jgi:hypothetical protein